MRREHDGEAAFAASVLGNLEEGLAMVDWWSETEHDIVECLRRDGALSPAELGRRVGVSETEAAMFLCMLAREGKIRIRLVESVDGSEGPSPCPLPRGERDSRELLPLEVGSGWA
jgi:hypothetical protein